MKSKYLPIIIFCQLILAGCGGYIPGQKAYWNSKIDGMCEKEGGIEIYEKVVITQKDIDDGLIPRTWPSGSIGLGKPNLGFTVKKLAHENAPVYAEWVITYIKQGYLDVYKSVFFVYRMSDNKLVAKQTTFARRGGDFPLGFHPSSYSCPDKKTLTKDTQELYVIKDRN